VNFKSIVKHIDSLPALSDVTLVVRKLYENGAENVNVSKLIQAIESDVILTANILKMINSPMYGFSSTISSVSQAVTLFGTHMVYGLVVRYSIESVLIANLRAYGVSNQLFNDISHMQSNLMREWYSKIDMQNTPFLASLTLIMESGKLVVAQEVTAAGNIKSFAAGLSNADNIIEYENSIFGSSSYYVSGLLFEHWNFDTNYVDMLKGLDYEHEAISELGTFIDALDVVRTAVNIKSLFTENSIDDAADIVHEMGLNVNDFIDAAHKIKENYLLSQSA